MRFPNQYLWSSVSRHFSSLPKLPKLSIIRSRHRVQAVEEAQQVLTDYLHSTRSLPFAYAENISKNSLFSLSNLISELDFSPSDFSKSFRRYLRYHPINEFEFFLESIGIDHRELKGFLPYRKFFFSEDDYVLNAACALAAFGFPWNRLGELYKKEISIFSKNSQELMSRLCGFQDFGFSSIMVIGICLAFPRVLCGDDELGGEVGALFDDLRKALLDFDLASSVENNVDAWHEMCRKIRLFYDLGCEKGKIGEYIGRNRSLLLEYSEEFLVQKTVYLSRFGVRKEDVGFLLLQNSEILNVDLETPVISVVGLLKHFGLSEKELEVAVQEYPYVFGRNKLINLPYVMRALNLHQWFFNKIKNGNHRLLSSYAISDPNEDSDKEYRDCIERIQFSRTSTYTKNKLDFLHGIGFGENALTIDVLAHVHGTCSELQDRFNCLLSCGIEFSKVCRMLRTAPKILNQKPESLEKKLKFLCLDLGTSSHLLEDFPAILCYSLEKRIKPRCRFHMWLSQKGLCSQKYSFASIVATSEKGFIARLYGIHPALPKLWLERSSYEKLING